MAKSSKEFSFGKNWEAFVKGNYSDERLSISQKHLLAFLGRKNLNGLTFLDIGCGSGLHSLAAFKSGAAHIVSFDYDPASVKTTRMIREMNGSPDNWEVLEGSVLDETFMQSLEPADIAYSWGVLHHTGDMWTAINNAGKRMKLDGVFYIALYSHEMYRDPTPEFWLSVKLTYNRSSWIGKKYLEWWYAWRFVFRPELRARRNPLKLVREYKKSRGMEFWTDVKDWLGGWPMEFAKVQDVTRFCGEKLDMELVNILTGEGNSEFLFRKKNAHNYWDDVVSSMKTRPMNRPFAYNKGFCWTIQLPEYEGIADAEETPVRSPLVVCEDGIPLAFAHSDHGQILREGLGRYSHRASTLYFASSDNTDPNTNGRSYTVRILNA